MKIRKIKQESTQVPDDTAIRHLSGTIYELIGNENVTSKQKVMVGKEVTVYESELTHITTSITRRDEMISALIRLRYTQDAEFALINKGILNAQDPEYVVYRAYVDVCKTQANIYFEQGFGSTLPYGVMMYGYRYIGFDNKVVVTDSVTSKVYKITPAIASGVLSWTLTEV